MTPLAQRVLDHVHRQELLRAGDRVGVAVSGGIDSMALLRLLLEVRHELGIVPSVVHFNHKLRAAESDADQQFVANLAREHDLQLHTDGDDVAQYASAEQISIETAARDLRYGFFRHLLGEDSAAEPHNSQALDKIVTGHTLDDQAETVLMRLIRGSGLRGLGGIHPRIPVENEHQEVCGEIVRPLLKLRRRELEQYLDAIGQPWREDSSNADDHFTRNRVRQMIVPLLEKEFNPSVAENLAELSEIARGEEDYWDNEISGWLGTTIQWTEPKWAQAASPQASLVQIGLPGTRTEQRSPLDSDLQSRIDNAPWLVVNASVSRMWFLGEPVAVQRRLVKAIGEHVRIPLEFKHVEEILRFAEEESAGKELSLPMGWKLVRRPDELIFLTPDLRETKPPQDYEYLLSIPGTMVVFEARSTFETRQISAGHADYDSDQLLDPESLHGPLIVRNWRPGDRFWAAHTKSPRKIKELLQERHVPQEERKVWPVVVSGEEIIWMRGFPSPAKFQAKIGHDAIVILEKPLAGEPTQ